MNWNTLDTTEQLNDIDIQSQHMPVMLFKHSTRCGTSATALNRLERNWTGDDSLQIKPYFLDLLRHRDVSDAISRHYDIEHQSPQVLLIKNGKPFYTSSHFDITYKEILEQV